MIKKHQSLIDKIYRLSNLRKAYRLCANHSSASGIDRVTWFEYRQNLNRNLLDVADRLRYHTYQPKPYRNVTAFIKGKQRKIYIPTVEDRLVQKSILLIIKPFFQDALSKYSFGYRYGKNKELGILFADDMIKSGRGWIADVDIYSFWHNINRSLIDSYLSTIIADGYVLSLIQTCLGDCDEGLPMGNGLSPFLSDIYLHQIDLILASYSIQHLRFSDTFLLFESSRENLNDALDRLINALTAQFLSINDEKTIIWYNPAPEFLFSREHYYYVLENQRPPRIVTP